MVVGAQCVTMASPTLQLMLCVSSWSIQLLKSGLMMEHRGEIKFLNLENFMPILSHSHKVYSSVLPVEQISCWTMFSAAVLTRPSSPVQIMELVYTTVTILRMWWFTVILMVNALT